MKIKKWINKNIDDLTGKNVVITGSTGGLGKELCYMLASLNANLILACRNKEKATVLSNEIKKTYPKSQIHFIHLDLENFESVEKCITSLKKYNGIDILINNAAIYNVPIKTLDSGYNNIFQVNFVYTYYLTKKLIPELQKKQNSTCITLGSIAHNFSKYNKYDTDFSKQKRASKIYGNSKRFLMFSLYELFKNSKVNLAIVHPGITLTNMTNHYPKFINPLVKTGIKLLFPSPKKACLNILYGTNHITNYHEWIGPSIFNIWGKPKKKLLSTCKKEESKSIFNQAEKIYNLINKKAQR